MKKSRAILLCEKPIMEQPEHEMRGEKTYYSFIEGRIKVYK